MPLIRYRVFALVAYPFSKDYDSYYCIWDSYRSIHPLITLLDPVSQTRMVRSLIDIYRHEGKLPDCRMSLCKGFTQGGSNADVVLADSYVKGLTGGIDWKTGYEAVVSDAEGNLFRTFHQNFRN
jgi:putative alpha-1,2-mannosidase